MQPFRKVSTSAKDELDAAVDELSSLSVKVNAELDETLQEQIKLNVSVSYNKLLIIFGFWFIFFKLEQMDSPDFRY